MRSATGLRVVSQSSAAISWLARDAGRSEVVFVLAMSTTKPWEAMRCPYGLMTLPGFMKPGTTASTPKRP